MAEETRRITDMLGWLEEQRAGIEAAIEALKHLESLGVGAGAAGLQGLATSSSGLRGIHGDTFVGMTIADAAAKYLEMVGRPARTTEAIVEALLRGGLQRVSPASVATILIRIHNADGPIVRVQKGLWGLASWYPKRPPRVTRKAKNGDDSGEKRKEPTPVKRRRGRPPKKRRAEKAAKTKKPLALTEGEPKP